MQPPISVTPRPAPLRSFASTDRFLSDISTQRSGGKSFEFTSDPTARNGSASDQNRPAKARRDDRRRGD
jgi:hypothetical protein